MKILEHPDVGGDPRGEILRARRFGVDQTARAQHADKQLDGDLCPGGGVDQVRPLAREIDKQLLAGAMHLTHRRLEAASPLPIALAKLAVGVAVRMLRAIFLPEQRQGDARLLQLLVQGGPIGQGAVARRGNHRPRKEPRFERPIVQIVRERPR